MDKNLFSLLSAASDVIKNCANYVTSKNLTESEKKGKIDGKKLLM